MTTARPPLRRPSFWGTQVLAGSFVGTALLGWLPPRWALPCAVVVQLGYGVWLGIQTQQGRRRRQTMTTDPIAVMADDLWRMAAHLYGDCVRALADNRVSLSEGAECGVHAATLAARCFTLASQLDASQHVALLDFLEHSRLVREDTP